MQRQRRNRDECFAIQINQRELSPPHLGGQKAEVEPGWMLAHGG